MRQKVSFEGQAAMELEMLADREQSRAYPYQLERRNGLIVFDPRPLISAVCAEQQSGVDPAVIAGRFHVTLAGMVVEVCTQLRAETALDSVVLSGGVFQNCLLTCLVKDKLERAAFEVLTHSLVPPNDGGLALGQAVVAGHNSPSSSR